MRSSSGRRRGTHSSVAHEYLILLLCLRSIHSLPMNADTVMSDAAAAAGSVDPSAPSPELARLQARVASHPQDFDAWCALVVEAERLKEPQVIRESITGLLKEFPLCFGYWQRLAKHEASITNAIHADAATIERGLEAVPHSHELWTYYVTELMKNEQANADDIRRSVTTAERCEK
jgi:hypothetical protein